jgi:hypothetical protein
MLTNTHPPPPPHTHTNTHAVEPKQLPVKIKSAATFPLQQFYNNSARFSLKGWNIGRALTQIIIASLFFFYNAWKKQQYPLQFN